MTRKNEIVIHGMPPLTYDMSCCGITNLAKHRIRREQFRRWDNKGVNCPHCLKSPTYRRLMAERAVRRINQTARPVANQYGKTWKRTICTGPE